jgi:hypothetical protein
MTADHDGLGKGTTRELTPRHDSFQADHLPNLMTSQRPRVTMLLSERPSQPNVDWYIQQKQSLQVSEKTERRTQRMRVNGY